MLTLDLIPHIERDGTHHDRFDAWLDGQLLLTSRQPLYDGARVLKAKGVDPATLLTMRHRGKAYDSIKPIAIDLLAELTVEESRRGLSLRKWRPFAGRTFKDALGPTSG